MSRDSAHIDTGAPALGSRPGESERDETDSSAAEVCSLPPVAAGAGAGPASGSRTLSSTSVPVTLPQKRRVPSSSGALPALFVQYSEARRAAERSGGSSSGLDCSAAGGGSLEPAAAAPAARSSSASSGAGEPLSAVGAPHAAVHAQRQNFAVPGGPVRRTEARSLSIQGAGSSSYRCAASKYSSRSVLVSQRQRGNRVLKYIRLVPWSFLDAKDPPRTEPDFVLSPTTGALFLSGTLSALSIRYHMQHRHYLAARLEGLKSAVFKLRVVLVLVDMEDNEAALREISTCCIRHHGTMIVAWSNAEVARYLETLKVYEKKPADFIQGRVEDNHYARVEDCLTSIAAINKTDVKNLVSNFGSVKRIMAASAEELLQCPGLGERKVSLLLEAFNGSLAANASLLQPELRAGPPVGQDLHPAVEGAHEGAQ